MVSGCCDLQNLVDHCLMLKFGWRAACIWSGDTLNVSDDDHEI